MSSSECWVRVAAALIPGSDDTVLAVWNDEHAGWVLPGGKTEPGELLYATMVRELKEETSLDVLVSAPLCGLEGALGRVFVSVYLVMPLGTPRTVEAQHPVKYVRVEELTTANPNRQFGEFHRRLFAELRKWELRREGNV